MRKKECIRADVEVASFLNGRLLLSAAAGAKHRVASKLVGELGVRVVVVTARTLALPPEGPMEEDQESTTTRTASVPCVSVVHLPALPNDGWHSGPLAAEGNDDGVEEYLRCVQDTFRQLLDASSESGQFNLCYLHVPLEDNKTQRLPVPLLLTLCRLIDMLYAVMDMQQSYGDDERGSAPQHKGSVLVHCLQGASRSVCCVAAYLMYLDRRFLLRKVALLDHSAATGSDDADDVIALREKLVTTPSFLTTIDLIEKMRPKADPNSWFRLLMMKFEVALRKGVADQYLV